MSNRLLNAVTGVDVMERLAMGDSPLHRLHPASKLIVTLVYITAVLSFPTSRTDALAAFALYPVAIAALSDTPVGPILKRAAFTLPFAVPVALGNLLIMRDAAFTLGNFTVTYGALSCVSILVKTALAVSALLLLTATTGFMELCSTLTRAGLPKVFCLQLFLTYRYVSVLADEVRRTLTAYRVRAPGQKVLLSDAGPFLGRLLLRSFDRAERVYHAMKCRGFRGEFAGTGEKKLRARDVAYMVCMAAAVAALRWFDLSAFLGGVLLR